MPVIDWIYGHWPLLLSWVPIVDDPLTVIAVTLREPFWGFLLIDLLAEAERYLVLVAVTLGALG